MSLPFCSSFDRRVDRLGYSLPPFSLNIPANNCAILQKGDDLELLPAGQHVITTPNVTLRGLFTLGENQLEMPTKDMSVFPVDVGR